MWMFALGIVAVVLKLTGFTAVAHWPWWLVVAPFAVAAVWWSMADVLGITRRNAFRRYEEKLQQRRARHLAALGMTMRGGADSRARGEPRRDRADRPDPDPGER